MGLFENKYNYNYNIFGIRLKGSGTKSQVIFMGLLWLAVALGVLALLAWGFQALWAWYVPVFWAGAPMLGYWHSLVTMLLLGAFLRRGGGKDD